jgi:hypothetical protein
LEGTLIFICRASFDGRFRGTSLTWAFIREGIPQVGCHDPHTWEMKDDGCFLWRSDFRSALRMGEENLHLIKLKRGFIGTTKGMGDKCMEGIIPN